MVSGEQFVAIDIGSSKIKTLIGEWDEQKQLRILGVGVAESRGIRKGNILDMKEFKSNLDTALGEAEKMTGEQVSQVCLGISGQHISVIERSSVVPVSGTEVTEEDVSRALDMAQSGIDLSNKTVLKVIPESFGLDLESGIKNPVGMSGKKLEVRGHIITMSSNVLSNIHKGVYDVGVEIIDSYPNLIAIGEATLSRRQKELGVVVVDIGSSATNVAVYEEGALIYGGVIPIGGELVTSDIALGLRISIDTAEKIKLEYGNVDFDEDSPDEEIDLSGISSIDTISISKNFMNEIIKARYEEIFHHIVMELKKVGRDGRLPEGIVLTGGGAKVNGLSELARTYMRLPASIGLPDAIEGITGTSIGDPIYTAVVGNLLLIQKYGALGGSSFRATFSFKKIFQSLKNLIKKIMPSQ
ncbi:cell division protein FtsA [Candidatus Gracilibacteria bacterium]|nr:MAG: cell division protein FtsA [Candidatus Gracilibacteria bacterium]